MEDCVYVVTASDPTGAMRIVAIKTKEEDAYQFARKLYKLHDDNWEDFSVICIGLDFPDDVILKEEKENE